MTLKQRLMPLGLWMLIAGTTIAVWAAGSTVVVDSGGEGANVTSGALEVVQDVGVGVVKSAIGVVKASPGTLYGVTWTTTDFTAGDKLEFKDALTNTGTSLLTLQPQSYNSTIALYSVNWANATGIAYATGIYMTQTETGSGTDVISIIYR